MVVAVRTDSFSGWGRPGRSATDRWRAERRAARHRRLEAFLWIVLAVTLTAVAVGVRAGQSGRMAAAAAAVLAASVGLVRWPRADPRRWLRGAAGEEATAALLDRLPPRRWAVLHDRRLPGSAANVDHLVVGPGGVWVVDSKAFRARLRAGWRSVRVGDRRLDTSAVAWEASVVAERLDVDVRPLVVVHGTGLPRRGRRCDGVRVLPAGSLVRHLRRRRTGVRLRPGEVDELADRAARSLPEA